MFKKLKKKNTFGFRSNILDNVNQNAIQKVIP